MDYVNYCPPAMVERIRGADFRQADASDLFNALARGASIDCQIAAIEAVAKRLDGDSDVSVVATFCMAVATNAPQLEPETREAVREAYLRMPYSPAIASAYFGALREAKIDITDHLKRRFRENWDFQRLDETAATWHYYLYLASLDQPGALERLADKVAAMENPTEVTHLLNSLAKLPNPGVDAVLERYLGDKRRAEGVSGPGLEVGKNVEILLMMRKERGWR